MQSRIFVLTAIVLSFLLSCKKDNTSDPKPDNIDPKTCTIKWMTKNLNVDHYRNGDSIPEVRDSALWKKLTTGAWCYYNNDSSNGAIYGKLYNWYAVNDPRGLAPAGWHVPTDSEWKILEICLGMAKSETDSIGARGSDEGGELKEQGVARWAYPNSGGSNSSGFSALPGGYRSGSGKFFNLEYYGFWWTSVELSSSIVWIRYLHYSSSNCYRNTYHAGNGLSVRCIQD